MVNMWIGRLDALTASHILDAYQTAESVERNAGMVSMVVITALRMMAKETHTFKAKAALLEEGSSSKRNRRLLKGF